MNAPQPVSEVELHAAADGRLDAARRPQVEAWLAGHPAEVARVAAWRDQNDALHRAFDAALNEPLPARLVEAARARPRRIPLALAAGASWLALGLVTGYAVRGWHQAPVASGVAAAAPAVIIQRAVLAHRVYVPEVRHPVEVAADQEAHLVTWLSKRLGTSVRACSLKPLGWELVGGRLLPGDTGPAAQFMYQDIRGQRLTLYLKPAPKDQTDTAFRYAESDGVNVFYWIDGPLSYALSGQVPREELLRVSEAVYQQVNVRVESVP